MKIEIAYGKNGHIIDVPDKNLVKKEKYFQKDMDYEFVIYFHYSMNIHRSNKSLLI